MRKWITFFKHLPFFKTNNRITSFLIALLFFISGMQSSYAQSNEAEWNGMGYSLKKVVSNISIQSGVNFSYTILFTAPAGAGNIYIEDLIPPALEVVTPLPVPADVCGVTPSLSVSGAVGSQTVSYSLTGLPSGCAASGSFTIVVKFPEGTTCNGATARNRAGIRIDDKMYYTDYVSTSAVAVDPWKISKSILNGPVVNPMGGSCGYLMPEGTTVKYRISILKNSPHYGSTIGQQNMTGAVVTDVLPPGAVLTSSTCGFSPTSGTITWNVGNLDVTYNSGYSYYYCDIEVFYPATSFPNGSIVNNEATLTGTMCGQQIQHTSNETCIEVADVTFTQNAYFKKFIYLTNRVPGCTGYYNVYLYNNGTAPLSAFDVLDNIPSGITVDQIKVYGLNATTTANVIVNTTGSPTTLATGASSTYISPAITYPVSDVKLEMTGTLPVGQSVYLQIYFTVDANPPGTVVQNCATFDGLSNSLTLSPACVSFTVAAGQPDPCLVKDVCDLQASYEPGDIIRFRIRVQNIGSADITGASFQDVLHSNFSYIGNESYYSHSSYNPPCSSGGGIPSGGTAWSGVTATHSGSNLNWNLPTIPSDCQSFYVAYCGYYGTYGLPYYYIEFDVEVSEYAMPGVTENSYDISGGNLVSTETSNTVNVLVVAEFGQEVEKEVSMDGGSTFASTGTFAAGGTARYRLNYKNTSNVPVSSVRLADLLAFNDSPAPTDWLILNRAVSRNSQFAVSNPNNHSRSLISPAGVPTPPTMNYANGDNACLPLFGVSGGCNTLSWGPSPVEDNMQLDFGGFALAAGQTLREEFDVDISGSATNQQTSCNDFAAISTAEFLLDGTPTSVALTPIASPPICISIDSTLTDESCCDSIKLFQIQNDKCCVRLVSECPVDSIGVSIDNGTIEGVSWNCATPPTGFMGVSNTMLHAGSCELDMTLCIDAIQLATSLISFTVYMSNGEVCEERIEVHCKEQEEGCCEHATIEQVMDATGENCCTKLVTDCAVDSVAVNITNGTFSGSSWMCGPIPAAHIGQSSYTFDAGQCIAELTTCIDPITTGTVNLTYDIYFSNGEHCVKDFQMDCEAAVDCCDSIRVQQVQPDPDLSDEKCCIEISSSCEVDSVAINLTNATFSSASWSCGTIPAGYIGQSAYTFDAGNCAIDLQTCFDATTTGLIVIDYIVYNSNGTECPGQFEIQCEQAVDCCDSIQVEKTSLQDEECCARLTSVCEVSSVEVTVTNGTLSMASWNCGTPLSGYAGSNNYTFTPSGPCAIDLTTCVEPTTTGTVYIDYLITLPDGSTCEERIEMDCKVDINCCDSVKVEPIQTTDGDCCALLTSYCEVDSVAVTVSNGTLVDANWSCGTIPMSYYGQNTYTFDAGGCAVDLKTCVKPSLPGVVSSISYVVYMSDGTVCDAGTELQCEFVNDDCCALVDFKLKHKWPFWNTQVGSFSITNADPSSPICSVEISASPGGTFTTGMLQIDGTTSGVSWNSTSIPATGTLSPPANNTIDFHLTAQGYKGVVTICVVKCDGTRCCFDFKWNKKPWIDIDIDILDPVPIGKLVAVSINPKVTTEFDGMVRYVSFGLNNEEQTKKDSSSFFAISASAHAGDEYPEGVAEPISSYMGKHNAFFELSNPKPAGKELGAFNLVFHKMLPELGCTLFDEDGNIIYSGKIDVENPDTIVSSANIDYQSDMFEFINAYPNPNQGVFNITYATSTHDEVEVRFVDTNGKLIQKIVNPDRTPGIRKLEIDARDVAPGLYRIVLISNGTVLNKGVIIND